MARTIRILPDAVANQIAAGEVVERPASVVKELVENALDADASRIEIQIEGGGKRKIRVSDDGRGMGREDALLSLDRHATSKIQSADDLRAVVTFGFRGEALPSIASISRFTLETRAQGQEVGTRVRAKGGRITAVDDVARTRGTTVTVEGLFFNAPARAKFLNSAAAEARAVSEILTPLALANPGVDLRLKSGGRVLLEAEATSSLAQRVAAVWGPDAADTMIPVELERDGTRVEGLVQRPDATRHGFRRSALFVYRRPFREAALLKAVDRGYRTTIPPEHRPWVVLFLDLPPGSVDVNVHPTKAEVRFRNRGRVEKLMEEAVRQTLEGEASAARFEGTAPPAASGEGRGHREQSPPDAAGSRGRASTPESHSGTDEERSGPIPASGSIPADGGVGEVAASAGQVRERSPGDPPGIDGPEPTPDPQMALFMSGGPGTAAAGRAVADEHRDSSSEGSSTAGDVPVGGDPAEDPNRARGEEGTDPTSLPEMDRPRLWQVHRSWILAEVRDGLLLIDQHAAHERVLFERIMERFDQGGAEGQRLLFPMTLQLTPAEYDLVEDLKGLLDRAGFEVEGFGGDTVIVHAVPAPHPHFDAERSFREMVEELTHGSELMRSARNQHERVAMSFACKAAIKAGQDLDQREMQELFDQLFATQLPFHDVHGRPTTVRLSRTELERKFGR